MAAVIAWLGPRLRSVRRQSLVLLVFVGIATAVVLTAAAGARRTDTAYDRLVEATATATARVQYTTTADVDDEVLARFRAHPDVEVAVPLYFTVAFSDRSDYDIGVVSSPDPDMYRAIDRLRVTSGRLPDPTAADEVVAGPFLADELDLEPGDALQLITFSHDQFDADEFDAGPAGPVLDLTVVGVASSPDDLNNEENPILYAGPGFFEAVDGEAGGFGPSLELLLRDGANALDVVEAAMTGIPVDEATEVETIGARSERVRDATQVLAMALVAFAVSAGLAAMVACGQAIARLLGAFADDQVPLQAMGFTRAQRFVAVVAAAVPVAAGGTVLGGVLAAAASPLMPVGIGRQAEPEPGFDVDVAVLGMTAAGAAVILLVSVAVTAWRISGTPRLDGSASMDAARSRRSAGAMAAARAGWSPGSVLGISMALEPGRGRTAVPVRPALVGAVVGVTGVVAALTFGASLDHLVSTPASYGWNWAVSPDLFEGDPEVLAGLPEVSDVGTLLFRQTVVEGHQVDGLALVPVAGRPSLTVLDGRMPGAPDEVALGPKTAEQLGKGVGDRLTAATTDGDAEVEVVGEVLFPVFDENAFNEGVAFHPDFVAEVSRSEGFGAGIVGFADGVSDAEGIAAVQEALPGAMTIYSYPSRPGEVANLARVTGAPFALATFLVVVALGAVAHAVVTSVRRRSRDLGVVRSLGFLRREVATSVTVQSITMVVVGLVVGVPLGVALGRGAWSMVADGLGVAPVPKVPVVELGFVAVGALVAAGLIGAWPARRAADLSPAAALRAE